MTNEKTPSAAEDRIPDIETAVRCIKSLLKHHRFQDEEHLYRDDLRVSISRIEKLTAAKQNNPASKLVNNDTRLKVLKEMGFEYEATRNEDGSLREHILMHEDWKGLFINHTSLLCAMRRALHGIHVLGCAEEKQNNPAPEDKEVAEIIEQYPTLKNGEIAGSMACWSYLYKYGDKILSLIRSRHAPSVEVQEAIAYAKTEIYDEEQQAWLVTLIRAAQQTKSPENVSGGGVSNEEDRVNLALNRMVTLFLEKSDNTVQFNECLNIVRAAMTRRSLRRSRLRRSDVTEL